MHTDIISSYAYILGYVKPKWQHCILSRMQRECSHHEFSSGTVKQHIAENFGSFFLFFFVKLTMKLLYKLAIILLDIYLKEMTGSVPIKSYI